MSTEVGNSSLMALVGATESVHEPPSEASRALPPRQNLLPSVKPLLSLPTSSQQHHPTFHAPSETGRGGQYDMSMPFKTAEEMEDFGTSFLLQLKGANFGGEPISNSHTLGKFSAASSQAHDVESAARSHSLPSISTVGSTSRPFYPDTRLCQFCGVFDTPMWRRGPAGRGTLCNACGIRWSQKNKTSQAEGGFSTGQPGPAGPQSCSPASAGASGVSAGHRAPPPIPSPLRPQPALAMGSGGGGGGAGGGAAGGDAFKHKNKPTGLPIPKKPRTGSSADPLSSGKGSLPQHEPSPAMRSRLPLTSSESESDYDSYSDSGAASCSESSDSSSEDGPANGHRGHKGSRSGKRHGKKQKKKKQSGHKRNRASSLIPATSPGHPSSVPGSRMQSLPPGMYHHPMGIPAIAYGSAHLQMPHPGRTAIPIPRQPSSLPPMRDAQPKYNVADSLSILRQAVASRPVDTSNERLISGLQEYMIEVIADLEGLLSFQSDPSMQAELRQAIQAQISKAMGALQLAIGGERNEMATKAEVYRTSSQK